MDAHIASKRYHVVFGTTKAGIYAPGTPVVARHSSTSALPIIFVCSTQKEAESINKLNGLCEGKVTKAVSGLPRIRTFLKLVEDYDVGLLSRCSEKWYGVWELHQGTREIYRTIFLQFADYSDLVKDLPRVHSSRHHRKFHDLVTAVVWMLARGDKQLLTNNGLSQYLPPADRRKDFDTPDTQTRNIDPNVITVTDDKEADEELPQPSGPSSSVTAPAIVNLVTPPSFATTQARLRVAQLSPVPASSASAFTKKGKRPAKRALTPTEDAPFQSPRPAPSVPAWLLTKSNFPDCFLSSPPPPSSTMSTSVSSASTLTLTTSSTAGSSTLASSSKINHPTAEHPSIPEITEARIFMRHRATDGTVTGSMRYDDPEFLTFPLPDSQHLPLSVIDYVRTHGYRRDMMVLVETAMAAAGGEELNFMRALALQNFPGAEAGFIWRLAHGSHAR